MDHPARVLTLPVLGIVTRFESSSAEVLEMAEEAFGAWRAAEGDARVDARPARVRIDVVPGDEEPSTVLHEPTATGLTVVCGGSRGVADAAARMAEAMVTEALVRDRARFRSGVLEALTLALLTRLDRQPLHAAAVAKGDRALLLSGPSGVGKSTLAYAALRARLKVMSEEMVFLQGGPVPRVWGVPGTVNLLPGTAAFFPELSSIAPTLLPNGDTKLVVSVRETGGAPPHPVVERAGVCLLARGDGGPRIDPLSPDEAVDALTAQLEPGFDHFAATIGVRVRPFAERGAWRLTLPPHPAAAVRALHTMLDAL